MNRIRFRASPADYRRAPRGGNRPTIGLPKIGRNDRVYKTDSYGRVRYGKPSYAVGKEGRVVQTDAYGSRWYDKPQY